jgi:hypothetical protein
VANGVEFAVPDVAPGTYDVTAIGARTEALADEFVVVGATVASAVPVAAQPAPNAHKGGPGDGSTSTNPTPPPTS